MTQSHGVLLFGTPCILTSSDHRFACIDQLKASALFGHAHSCIVILKVWMDKNLLFHMVWPNNIIAIGTILKT